MTDFKEQLKQDLADAKYGLENTRLVIGRLYFSSLVKQLEKLLDTA